MTSPQLRPPPPRFRRDTLLTVSTEARKGRRCDRIVQLSPDMVSLLAKARAAGRPELVWWPLNRSYLWDRLKSMLAAAGLSGKRIGFQQVRRTGASHYSAAGGRASTYHGHGTGSSPRGRCFRVSDSTTRR